MSRDDQAAAHTLRVKISPALFAKINEYRHVGRHETKNEAMIELLNAGLAALVEAGILPAAPQAKPEPRLVPFAGEKAGLRSGFVRRCKMGALQSVSSIFRPNPPTGTMMKS